MFKKFARLVRGLALSLGTLSALYLGLWLYRPSSALWLKIKTQNFIGQRKITDEVWWALLKDFATLNSEIEKLREHDSQLCALTPTTWQCFDRLARQELTAARIMPASYWLLIGQGLSLAYQSEQLDAKSSIFKLWKLSPALQALLEAAQGPSPLVLHRLQREFGTLNEAQRQSALQLSREPWQLLRHSFTK